HFRVTRFLFRNYKGINTLSFYIMWVSDNGPFDHTQVHIDRVFKFGGSHTVARYVQDVVATTCNTIAPVFISQTAVTSEVHPGVGREIGLFTTLVITVSRAYDTGPGEFDTKVPRHIIPLQHISVLIDYNGLHSGQR